MAQAGGQLLSLSEQELVDCSQNDNGCNGGLPARAYKDLISGKMGLELESEYPYHATVGKCVKDQSKYKVFISDWVAISHDEDKMAASLVRLRQVPLGSLELVFWGAPVIPFQRLVFNEPTLEDGDSFFDVFTRFRQFSHGVTCSAAVGTSNCA